MKHIHFGFDENVYHSNFEIGDVVRIWNLGHCFTTFKRVFEKFGLSGINEIHVNADDKKENWLIVDMIIVKCSNYYPQKPYDVLCHLKNKKGKSIVIGEDGLKKRPININVTKSLKQSNLRIKVL